MISVTMETPTPSAPALYVCMELSRLGPLTFFQAFFRRTNIATKLKITYLRDGLLDVCFLLALPIFLTESDDD